MDRQQSEEPMLYRLERGADGIYEPAPVIVYTADDVVTERDLMNPVRERAKIRLGPVTVLRPVVVQDLGNDYRVVFAREPDLDLRPTEFPEDDDPLGLAVADTDEE